MLNIQTTTFLGALLLGALAAAQDKQPPEAPPPSPAKAEYTALIGDYGKAQREYAKKFREESAKAQAEGKAAPAFAFNALTAEWQPKFQAAADKYKGTDGAIPFLLWMVGNDGNGKGGEDPALTTLLANHITSPEFGNVTSMIGHMTELGENRVREILGQILSKNQNGDVQAQAFLARASLVLERKEIEDAARKDALADLEHGVAKAKDQALKSRLEGALFEQQRLQPGMPAPDIAANDLDGVAFKLSEYKGKVVLLDFWGDW